MRSDQFWVSEPLRPSIVSVTDLWQPDSASDHPMAALEIETDSIATVERATYH